jgi:hypothetical protein
MVTGLTSSEVMVAFEWMADKIDMSILGALQLSHSAEGRKLLMEHLSKDAYDKYMKDVDNLFETGVEDWQLLKMSAGALLTIEQCKKLNVCTSEDLKQHPLIQSSGIKIHRAVYRVLDMDANIIKIMKRSINNGE